MTIATQLHLFLPVSTNERFNAWLSANWPHIEPWGDLSVFQIARCVQYDVERVAILMERPGHRMHLLWSFGDAYASGDGWTNWDGKYFREVAA